MYMQTCSVNERRLLRCRAVAKQATYIHSLAVPHTMSGLWLARECCRLAIVSGHILELKLSMSLFIAVDRNGNRLECKFW